ncbi:uncharacterized protein M421DRAFT_162260 [Didymella exigua CBS 183.55]|uniref:C2H2 type master regulator of conidiophore development brlA n=1 Tax=Didymella exigua CBS 183.55 TaxID=1150837 RepID=A0A6A5RNF7_9PLEO|nr:uncharacterized protein M421DRAFT_162260 [Didymella exigua CBS 183.55]KAF1927866.1 hypothetical protein M421DRAFT_162260 [Didymella exigua CBS 183.55]
MLYTEQPTPPFNSPYQTHASREDSLLEAPYLSPSQHNSMSRYPQGLGLYNYHHQAPTTLPPSPSPSEPWSGHVSTGASPIMTQAIADPYASGAFDHPIIRSPQPWDGSQLSPRSSVSSATMVSVHSHPGSNNAYHEMTTANFGSHSWSHDARYTHNEGTLPLSRHCPLIVVPERLNNNVFPYDNPYDATQIPRMEPTLAMEYDDQAYLRASSEMSSASRPEYPQTPAHRQRIRSRRHTDPATAAFVCTLCKPQKGFARNYNFKQHMETHNPNRAKPHVCRMEGCQKAFVRKLDLDRHNTSVHKKERGFKCDKCPADFARKDTCGR